MKLSSVRSYDKLFKLHFLELVLEGIILAKKFDKVAIHEHDKQVSAADI